MPEPARVRSPRYDRLDTSARSSVLSALRTLRTHGVENVESVAAHIAQLTSGRPEAAPPTGPLSPSPPDTPHTDPPKVTRARVSVEAGDVGELIAGLGAHLRGFSGDLRSGVYQWLCAQQWWWGGPSPSDTMDELKPEPEPQKLAAPKATEEVELPEKKLEGAKVVQGVGQAVRVLNSTLSKYATPAMHGDALVCLEVASDDTLGFGDISSSFREYAAEAGGDLKITFCDYPTATSSDYFRNRTVKKRPLMQASVILSREANFYQSQCRFELFVNLMGESVSRDVLKDHYTDFVVITAQGQTTGVRRGSKDAKDSPAASLTAVTGRDAITKCQRLEEGVHRFKMALVRAIEHTIHHVIHSDFMSEMEDKVWECDLTTTRGRLDARKARGSVEMKKTKSMRKGTADRTPPVQDPLLEADDESDDDHPLVSRSFSCRIPVNPKPARPVETPRESPRDSMKSSEESILQEAA